MTMIDQRPIDEALNVLLDTDAYKLGHRQQYPDGTEFVYSNLTARSSRIDGVDRTVFFGLQAYLRQLRSDWDKFFALDEEQLDQVLSRYEQFNTNLLGPNEVGSSHFRALWQLGYLPLEFRALPEGSLVPLGVPYLTYQNTHPDFFWLTNYLETSLSANIWQPITSATLSWRSRNLLNALAIESTGSTAGVEFQGHDFSYRGMAGDRAAAASGAGHLLSFVGTDSLPSIRFLEQNYDAGNDGTLVGASVPATEHSVMSAGGRDGEFETFERLLDLYPTGILSVVSDTWNLWEVLTDYLPRLKDKILARDGKLVIRPDSGDPEWILCGTKSNPNAVQTPEVKTPATDPAYFGVVNLLWEVFGGTVNEKGMRELDPHIGTIYGDSITYERAGSIAANLMNQGYASTVPVFGFGSYTFQYQTRDTFGMAVKATWTQRGGQGFNLRKDPLTDNGNKRSASGRLAVRRTMAGDATLVEDASPEQMKESELKTVFVNGALERAQTLTQVRERLELDTKVYLRGRGER